MKKVVLCGSMKVKDKIVEIAKILEKMEYEVLLPVECMEGKEKHIASRAHLDRIVNSDSQIILVVNEKKNKIDNYIGPNTFAEIAFGYYYNKKIFLLNDIYKPYEDELLGWNIIPLKGDLTKIESGD